MKQNAIGLRYRINAARVDLAEKILAKLVVSLVSRKKRRGGVGISSIIRRMVPESIRRRLRLVRAQLLSVGLLGSGKSDQPEKEIEAARDISIVVPIYDAPEVTKRCLASLERYASNAEIILVDDGSTIPEAKELIHAFQLRNGWPTVRHDKPKGHSRSCEAGARLATRPYICLLNSDTVATPWSWWAAKEAFERDARVGVSGPSTSHAATVQVISRARYCRHYWNDAQINAFARDYVASRRPRSWVDLPEVSGFAFFIRRFLWETLGGFDAKLPDYGNESELCKRLGKSGWRIIWTQNSYIHHFGGQSYGRMGSSYILHRARTARRYINHKYER